MALFKRHKRRYGTRRLHVTLREKGRRIDQQALRTALASFGLHCVPNRLLDQPTLTRGNRVWVPDITYLPLADGRWVSLPGRLSGRGQ